VLTPDGLITGEHGYVAVMTIADDDMKIGVAGAAKSGDARKTGRAVARAAMASVGISTPPAYFYMAAPPGEEESYLRGVEDVIGRVPFFGGSAADNSVEGKWKVLFGREAYSDGLSLACSSPTSRSAPSMAANMPRRRRSASSPRSMATDPGRDRRRAGFDEIRALARP